MTLSYVAVSVFLQLLDFLPISEQWSLIIVSATVMSVLCLLTLIWSNKSSMPHYSLWCPTCKSVDINTAVLVSWLGPIHTLLSLVISITAFTTTCSLIPERPLCGWWDMGDTGSHPWQWWIWQEESVNDIPPLMAGATSHTFAFPFIIPAFIIMG